MLGQDHFYLLSMSLFTKNDFAFGVVLNEVKCLASSFSMDFPFRVLANNGTEVQS